MTQPFKSKTDEKVDVELKVGNEGPVSPPAVIDAEERSELAPAAPTPEKESTATGPESASPLKPTRPRKELNLPATILGLTVLSVLPIIIFAISLVVDPEAMPYMQGRLTAPDKKGQAVAHLSDAYAAHRNVEILDDRQRAYQWDKNYDSATIDRQILVDHNVGNARPYRNLAASRIKVNGVTETSLALLRKSAALSRDHLNKFWLDLGMDNHNLFLSLYDLLACNDSKTAAEVSALTNQKGLKPYELSLLRALALRENGHSVDALTVLNSIEHADGRFGNIQYSIAYFKVLSNLDLHNTREARKKWLAASEYGDAGHRGMRYLTGAWLSFQEGDMEKALAMSYEASKEFKQADQSIPNIQAQVALERLRELAYRKQGDRVAAEIMRRSYKNKNLSGWMFTPKPDRITLQ